MISHCLGMDWEAWISLALSSVYKAEISLNLKSIGIT